MKGVAGTSSRPLVQEVCTTCGKHDSSEQMWMMFPGTDLRRALLVQTCSDGRSDFPTEV
ncbi:hypothetical protein JHK86_010005 [Glycine max]|nr:hypothetical protein JHK86_010005 [Glycine max]